MSVSDVAQGLIDFVSKELLSNRRDLELGVGEDLLGSGLVDSLGVMRLVTHIEKTYGVSVPPDDVTIENFMSVETMVAYLGARGVEDGKQPVG